MLNFRTSETPESHPATMKAENETSKYRGIIYSPTCYEVKNVDQTILRTLSLNNHRASVNDWPKPANRWRSHRPSAVERNAAVDGWTNFRVAGVLKMSIVADFWSSLTDVRTPVLRAL